MSTSEQPSLLVLVMIFPPIDTMDFPTDQRFANCCVVANRAMVPSSMSMHIEILSYHPDPTPHNQNFPTNNTRQLPPTHIISLAKFPTAIIFANDIAWMYCNHSNSPSTRVCNLWLRESVEQRSTYVILAGRACMSHTVV